MADATLSLARVFRPIMTAAKYGALTELRYQVRRSRFSQHRTECRLDFNWAATPYNRTSVINLLLAARPDSRYLEIGCGNNNNFNSVIAAEKIGVDPYVGGTHRMTSNDFFKTWNGSHFDVIFIDGLHTYEQAAEDIRNAVKFLKEGGWVVLHDLLPRTWQEEHVPRLSADWMGNVWKVAFELSQTEDTHFKIFKIDFGVGILKPLTRNINIPDLKNELWNKQFLYLYENINKLPLVEYQEGRQWLVSQTR